MSLLPQIIGLAATVAGLSVLSRWISLQVQIIGWRLTGDERAAVVIYYLLLLPGILLHELCHLVMARLLGLKVGKLSLGPKARGQYVQLGSVTVASGGVLRDSLVGMAPFLGGTAVLLAVGYRVFDVGALGEAWLSGGWRAVLGAVPSVWQVPDFGLWAYVIFAVSNAMMPSAADRQPWLIAGLYLLLAALAAYLLGALAPAATAVAPTIAGALPALILGLLLTLLLDLLAAALFLLIERLIAGLAHQR
jgi:hypothetical protein